MHLIQSKFPNAIYTSPFGSVALTSDKKAVVLTWRGAAYGNAYTSLVLKAAEACLVHNCKVLLSNTQAAHVVSEQDLQWLKTQFLPYLSGFVRYVGVVVAYNSKRMKANNTIRHSGESVGIAFCYFDNMEEAKKWTNKVANQQ